MKINLKHNAILKNKILILLFIILVSCDSTGDSDNGDTQNSDPGSPTTQPTPVITPDPVIPPQIPTGNPAPIPDPPPVTTNPPLFPTPGPTNNPTPTAQPTQAPAVPTPVPTREPVPTPEPGQPLNEFQSLVLGLVNNARSQARNCGSEFFSAAPAVNWDTRIENAALAHSEDMAQNQNFSHTGTDGSNTGDRLLMQNYNWNTWGENILVGLDNARDAIDAWIGSSGHCSIIMNPSLKEVGAGIAEGIFQGRSASYWTLVFASER